MILHFVGPGKLFRAHRTREHFPLLPLVIQEGVPLEAVFVFERFREVHFGALRALIYALVYRRVPEQIQPSHRHFGELLGGILALRRHPAPDPSLFGWFACWGAHGVRTRRRGAHVVVVVQHAVRGAYPAGFRGAVVAGRFGVTVESLCDLDLGR